MGCSDNITVKTVYDPSPVGFKVPNGNTFNFFNNYVSSLSFGYYFKRNDSDTTGIFFPKSGYRSGSSGDICRTGISGLGKVWTSAVSSNLYAYSLSFSTIINPNDFETCSSGYSICCVAE
jgi:hypothetical protein